jgi:hypothetical protein
MIKSFLLHHKMPNVPLPDRLFMALAKRQLGQMQRPDPDKLVPMLKFST